MATMPPNPHFAFIRLSVGGSDLSELPPKHITGFTYLRFMNTGTPNKFVFSLFDETALALEYQLAQGMNDVTFQYGYVNGDESPVYSGMITEYDIDFTSAGALLNVEGHSMSAGSFETQVSQSYEGKTIDQIFREVCEEEGWIPGRVIPCEPVPEGDIPNKTFVRSNKTALAFINQDLIPLAKSSETGDSGYVVNFEDYADGMKANFYPTIQAGENSGSSGGGSSYSTYEFQWGTGDRNSRVIRFNPDYHGTLTMLSSGATLQVNAVDNISDEEFDLELDNTTDSTRTVLASKSPYRFTDAYKRVGSTSYTKEQMNNMAAYMWYANANNMMEATLEILGDPNIEGFNRVMVIMLNKDGQPHHSSGLYQVKEIEDNIQDGLFTTKLILFKNATSTGVDSSGGVDVSSSNGGVGSNNALTGGVPALGTGQLGLPSGLGLGSISSYFGWRDFTADPNHAGVDFPVSYGSDIFAADGGTVISVTSSSGGYGNTVKIDHGNGIVTQYSHLSGFNVSRGDTVAKGDKIASSGNSGLSTGPHLHFGVYQNGTAVDPLNYLR